MEYKKFIIQWKSVLIITAMVAGAVMAVAAALVQRNRNLVAPTAPGSQPKASVVTEGCSVAFDVPKDIKLFCTKQAYKDEIDNAPGTYHLRSAVDAVHPGDVVVYSLTIQNSGIDASVVDLADVFTLDQNVSNGIEYLDSNCPGATFDPVALTLTCTNINLGAKETKELTFRARINSSVIAESMLANTASFEDQNDGTYSTACSEELVVATQKTCGDACDPTVPNDCLSGLSCANVGSISICRDSTMPNDETCGAGLGTPTATDAPTSTLTPSNTPTDVPANIATATNTPSNTPTHTATSTHTPSPTSTHTPTYTPTFTATFTPTFTATRTPTHTPTFTLTPTYTSTPTRTPTFTATYSPTRTPTFTATRTPTNTNTPTGTFIASTNTPTFTPSNTPTNNPSSSATYTPSVTPTGTYYARCNEPCGTVQCADTNHVCYQGRCRMANNLNSETCAYPVATNTQFIPALPRSGFTNQNFFIIGAVVVTVLIVGGIILLLML